jgi:pimeloyl-ACP methyl ester carboxylesterase
MSVLGERTIDTPRGRFAALANGRAGAPPLLALHGWLDNAASFVPMAAALAECDLVALDLPGHGASFHSPPTAEYSLYGTLLDLLAAANALGWPRFALLGHSLGGALATLLAAVAPERVSSLHLIEALGPLSAEAEGTAQRIAAAIAARHALEHKPKRVFADADTAVRARMQAHVTPLDAASARLLVARGLAAVPGGFAWTSDQRLTLPTALRLSEAAVRDCLRSIRCPVRVVVADPAPPYFPPAMREARAACVADLRVQVLPGGHHLHMTTPDAVATALELTALAMAARDGAA